jgi:hypothetical protein
MSWLRDLKQRWLRGRGAEHPGSDHERRVDDLMTSPHADEQVASLPPEQVDEAAGRTPPTSSASPDEPER